MISERLKVVYFRFYEELNDFLPFQQRKAEFEYRFSGNQSIKDVIEAIGVPHIEIDLIIVNGESVSFTHQLQGGERVAVYPVFESIDISPLIQLRPAPLRVIKFVLDAHLGKLAKYLRLLGFDTLFSPQYQDAEIVDISLQEKRIALTRDKGLLKSSNLTHGYWVRATNPTEQTKEIIARFDLASQTKPFTRCLECNGELVAIDKKEIQAQLPAKTSEYYRDFYRCAGCGKIYWEGPHYQKMKQFVEKIMVLSSLPK